MLVRRADIASHVALSGRPGQRTANVEVVPQTEVCALEGVDGTHQEVVLVGGGNSAVVTTRLRSQRATWSARLSTNTQRILCMAYGALHATIASGRVRLAMDGGAKTAR